MNHVAPQRTVIGRLIFSDVTVLSSFINTTDNINLFADETSIDCFVKGRYLTRKFKGNFTKTEQHVEMNKLTLSTNKTELIFLLRNNSDFISLFYKNEDLTTQNFGRYLGIQIYRNFIFDELLNKILKKMAHAIKSL